MSLLSRLFGGGGGGSSAAKEPESESYQGYRIFPDPQKAGTSYRVAARIEKDVDGETKVHQLVRADTMESLKDASDASLEKAKRMIDEQGDGIFR